MSDKKILTSAQQELRDELIAAYGLEAEQISFDGEDANPILDYEALCALRIRLTDFKNVTISEPLADVAQRSVAVVCAITLADDRTISASEKVTLGDLKPDGKPIEQLREAEVFARARAMRFAIRTAGVNLLRAHREYMKTGKTAIARPIDPRTPLYQEIHALAGKLGFIAGKDKTAYENYLGALFEGRTSCTELDDIELQKLLVSFRSFARLQRSTLAAEAGAPAA